MRELWLTLTDARLRAVLKVLKTSGPGLGELAADPGAAHEFLRPLRAALAGAAATATTSPAASRALAAAEDFTARLEKVFSDLALHQALPDPALKEALQYLQQACAEAPGLLSLGGRARALEQIRGLTAGAHKVLARAGTAAASTTENFPLNLKFSSIYSGLDAVFYAYESCAEALFTT